MATIITRRLEFDAGHRLIGHEGKCKYLHGHRYVAEITIYADRLDKLGRVVDFGVVKDKLGSWIENNWDHNMILHKDDPLLKVEREIFGTRYPYVLSCNPTAENLAEHLSTVAERILLDCNVTKVTIWETPNCKATFSDEEYF